MRFYILTKLFLLVPLLTLYILVSMVSDPGWWIFFGILLYYPFHQLGFSIGIHKLLSHRAFTPVTWYPYVAVLISSICFYGNPIFNVLIHRLHHRYSDSSQDPHSPTRGRWHAFAGWMLTYQPPFASGRYLMDLDRDFKFLQKYKRIELFVPIIFHISTYLINPTLFLVCLLASLLSFYNGLLTNAFSHDPKTAKALDSKILARFVNPIFMHEYHHASPGEYDYSHKGVTDFSSNFIQKFLMAN